MRFAHFNADPMERVRAHAHPNAHLLFLLRGAFAERQGKTERIVQSGATRLSGAEVSHDIDFSAQGAECLVLHLAEAPTAPGASRFFDADDRSADCASLSEALSQLTEAPRAALLARRTLARFASAPAVPSWFDDSWRLLEGGDIASVTAAARAVGVSREHLARAFMLHAGVSPQLALRIARATRAARLATKAEAPLAHVAGECGYADQSHLARELNWVFGFPPSRLRSRQSKADALSCA